MLQQPAVASEPPAGAALLGTVSLSSESSDPEGRPLSGDDRQLASDLKLNADVYANPLIASLLKSGKSRPQDIGQDWKAQVVDIYRTLESHQAKLVGVVWAVPSLLLIGAAFYYLTGSRAEARAATRLCHGLLAKWLIALSAVALVTHFTLGANIWASVPVDLWKVPIGGLLVAAGLHKSLDLNAPVWNSTLLCLLCPLGSCLLVLGVSGGRALVGV